MHAFMHDAVAKLGTNFCGLKIFLKNHGGGAVVVGTIINKQN
jgi:hypothetical protein